MDAQHHRQLQQARQRIARNRRVVHGDVLQLSQSAQAKLNWRLQSQEHPLAMLLGAVGVGVVASRLLSRVSVGQGWERTLLGWAKRSLDGSFWQQVLEMVWPRREDDETDVSDTASGQEATA